MPMRGNQGSEKKVVKNDIRGLWTASHLVSFLCECELILEFLLILNFLWSEDATWTVIPKA